MRCACSWSLQKSGCDDLRFELGYQELRGWRATSKITPHEFDALAEFVLTGVADLQIIIDAS